MHRFRRFITISMLLAGGPCLAATVSVTANPDLTFAPTMVTILAGDSVTFTNTGGFHNVFADDGAFRCAGSCRFGAVGSGGEASGSDWQFTLRFVTPGSIGYHCEVHGSPGAGMYGTILVLPNSDLVFTDGFDPRP